MESGKFRKRDEGFICLCCGGKVDPLVYSSRDHCPQCLCSLHVDINPGDRANVCGGPMIPVMIEPNNKKGYIITYRCAKCGEQHKNRSAIDDNFETMLSVMKGTYKERLEKIKKGNKA